MMAEEVNNLQPEIKEETEEEKIDIEYHFHPVISSCEEDFGDSEQLQRHLKKLHW